MIIGDKIATLNLTRNNVPKIVEVIAIEKHEIKWRYRWSVKPETDHWHVAYAHIDYFGGVYYAVGRVRKRDREAPTGVRRGSNCGVDALTVSVGLSPEFKTDP